MGTNIPRPKSHGPAISAFELIAENVLGIKLGPECHAVRERLVHPVHQILRVFGYEVLGLVGEK